MSGSPASVNTVIALGGGSPVLVGSTNTGLVGFYGYTPVVQPTSTNEAAPSSVAPVSVTATQWGFSTSTQAQAILTLVTQLRADLVTLGIIKGS